MPHRGKSICTDQEDGGQHGALAHRCRKPDGDVEGEGSRIGQAQIMVACTISAQGLAQNKKAFHTSYFILLS